jgi:hypothetical protein
MAGVNNACQYPNRTCARIAARTLTEFAGNHPMPQKLLGGINGQRPMRFCDLFCHACAAAKRTLAGERIKYAGKCGARRPTGRLAPPAKRGVGIVFGFAMGQPLFHF